MKIVMVMAVLAVVSFFVLNLLSFTGNKSNELLNNVSTNIKDKVDLLNEIKVTQLDNAISKLIDVAESGVLGVVESTKTRTRRYLKKADGDHALALETADKRINTAVDKVVQVAISNIPLVGIPYSVVVPYWKKVRYLLLVASLHNHSTTNETVREAISDCLVNSALYSIGQKVEKTFMAKTINYVTKWLGGSSLLGKVVSVPAQAVLVFLENDKAIIECGRAKFG